MQLLLIFLQMIKVIGLFQSPYGEIGNATGANVIASAKANGVSVPLRGNR